MKGSHTKHQKVILTDNQPSSQIVATVSRTITTMATPMGKTAAAATSMMNGQMLDRIKGIKTASTLEAMNLTSRIVCSTMWHLRPILCLERTSNQHLFRIIKRRAKTKTMSLARTQALFQFSKWVRLQHLNPKAQDPATTARIKMALILSKWTQRWVEVTRTCIRLIHLWVVKITISNSKASKMNSMNCQLRLTQALSRQSAAILLH